MDNNTVTKSWKSDERPIPEPEEIKVDDSVINDLMIKRVKSDDKRV